jgi:hypothetical protein
MAKKDEPEFQEELGDIFEEIWFIAGKSNDLDVIEENITEIMKRHKLWRKGLSLCFPAGAMAQVDPENETYQYDFEIFSDPQTLIASGTCYGSGRKTSETKKKDTFEVVDMTLEIWEGFGKLRVKFAKEKVEFT